jgi:hypothetical protein
MRRDTENFSMYSLMSTRMSADGSANRNLASERASSVLPTPVGPQKTNEPMGRFGSLRPARLRRIEREMALIASSWRDDGLVQLVFHAQQAGALGLLQSRDRDAGPAAHDEGDFLLT